MLTRVLEIFAWSLLLRRKFTFFIARVNRDDLMTLCGLIQAGKLTPAIDRRYPLADASSAMAYAESGHAQAKVVITFHPEAA